MGPRTLVFAPKVTHSTILNMSNKANPIHCRLGSHSTIATAAEIHESQFNPACLGGGPRESQYNTACLGGGPRKDAAGLLGPALVDHGADDGLHVGLTAL